MVAIPFAVAVARLLAAPTAHLTLPDDLALIDLHTRRALVWKQQLGVFDHNNWNHPGPTYFYLLSLAYRVLGLGGPGAVRGCDAAQRAGRGGVRGGRPPADDTGPGAVGGAGGLRRSASGWPAAGPAATTYSEAVLGALVSPWNPTVVIFPLLLLLSAVRRGRRPVGPVLVGALLVGSFVVQTDISTLPVAVALVVVAGGHVVGRRPCGPAGGDEGPIGRSRSGNRAGGRRSGRIRADVAPAPDPAVHQPARAT